MGARQLAWQATSGDDDRSNLGVGCGDTITLLGCGPVGRVLLPRTPGSREKSLRNIDSAKAWDLRLRFCGSSRMVPEPENDEAFSC